MEKTGLPSQNLPQLYRFCFLMVGDAVKATDVFQTVMHEASLRAAQGELPRDRLALFRDARYRCLHASESGVQAEPCEMEEHPIGTEAPKQIERLEAQQLAVWVSSAPDPQRTALAAFYLDEFDHDELLELTELKTPELAKFIGCARQEFQAWLDATVPNESEPSP